MIRTLWRNRAHALYKEVHERIAIKQARGKMPHWSTYARRKESSAGPFSHMLRPRHYSSEDPSTLCGWHQASFRAARSFGLPRHELWAAAPAVEQFCQIGNGVACPHCFDVVSDIATWIDMTSGRISVGQVHMAWGSLHQMPACNATSAMSAQTLLFRDYAAYLSTSPLDACSVCSAIFGRLFGPNRPENEYLTHTTNEEASGRSARP